MLEFLGINDVEIVISNKQFKRYFAHVYYIQNLVSLQKAHVQLKLFGLQIIARNILDLLNKDRRLINWTT